jgi:hypothetical protein
MSNIYNLAIRAKKYCWILFKLIFFYSNAIKLVKNSPSEICYLDGVLNTDVSCVLKSHANCLIFTIENLKCKFSSLCSTSTDCNE